jgi:hypothetical protein
MATLIPEYQLKDFQLLSATDIKKLKCCEVFEGEEYLFTFICPTTDYIKARAEDTGQLSNTVGGESIEQIIQMPPSATTVSTGTITDFKPEIYIASKPYKSKRKKVKV